VSLLITSIFWDEMEVFAADNDCSVHLCGDNSSSKDTTTDGN
jgi:hypothetical protein